MPDALDYEFSLLKHSLENKDVDINYQLLTDDRKTLFKIFRRYYEEFKDFPNADTMKALISEYQLDKKLFDTYQAIRISKDYSKGFCENKLSDEYFERLIQRAIAKYNGSTKENKREKYEEFVDYLITERKDVSELVQGFVWESAHDRWKEFEARADGERQLEGVPTHIKPIDDYLGGAVDGRFNVFFGLPKSGKTTMLMNIADNLSFLEGEEVIYISGEMKKRELEMIIDAKRSMINSRLIRNGSLSPSLKKRFGRMLEEQWKRKARLFIIEPTGYFTTSDCLSYARIYEKKYKPQTLPKMMIDYLWIMGTEQKYSGDWDRLDKITYGIYQKLCRELGYCVFSCTHESRGGALQKRAGKERGQESVQGSSRIAPNVSALILQDVFYEEEELLNQMQLKCEVNRHGAPFKEYVTYLKEFSYIGSSLITVPKSTEVKDSKFK